MARILFCGSGWHGIVGRIAGRLDAASSIRIWDRARPLTAAIAEAEVIIPSNARIDAPVLEAAPALRLIQQTAAGYEGIDLEAARARGIPVCNAPGKNAAAVAEAALFLMLSLARRAPKARRAFRDRIIGEPAGLELRGKTLGIVGRGASGRALAQAAEGLGMQVRSIDSKSSSAEREAMLRAADFLSLHCPLTPATRGLIGDRALALMKPTAFLINCARGPVVDRDALVSALEAGRIAGVGLDVHWNEPADPESPLYLRDDVVALPHVAGSTEESFDRLVDVLLENLARLARGEALLHRVG
jgi:phosphoglycerate dehydrogenase-like enzyme